MPELPEVITITKDLEKELKNKKIYKIYSYSKYPLKPNKKIFCKATLNSKVTKVGNIAKLIYIKLSSNYFIATHLNMTGRLLYNTKDKYIKIGLEFKTGDILYYSTVRMFGYFEVWDKNKITKYKKKYGPTPLNKKLSLEVFTKKIKSTNTYIKNALLNQKLISGIGNIYANDALFLSSINPKKKTGDLSDEEYKRLFKNIKIVLKEGLKHRGSTIDRFTDIYGKSGKHQNFFKIYGKKHQKCPKCTTLIKFEKLGGRGTFYCPKCQK